MCKFVLCQGRNSEQKLSLSSLRALGVSCRVVHRSITLAQMSWPKQPWRHRRHTKLHVDRGARGTRNRPPPCTSSTCITTHHIRTLYRVVVIERLHEFPILELILGRWSQSFMLAEKIGQLEIQTVCRGDSFSQPCPPRIWRWYISMNHLSISLIDMERCHKCRY